MAKSISVAVGDSDTMCRGWAARVSAPTVTGKSGAVAVGIGVVAGEPDAQPPSAAARAATSTAANIAGLLTGPPVGRGVLLRRQGPPGAPSARHSSSRALLRDHHAGDLAQPRRGASQLRDSAG